MDRPFSRLSSHSSWGATSDAPAAGQSAFRGRGGRRLPVRCRGDRGRGVKGSAFVPAHLGQYLRRCALREGAGGETQTKPQPSLKSMHWLPWLTGKWRQHLPSPWLEVGLALAALVAGAIVGLERERRDKPAGLRDEFHISGQIRELADLADGDRRARVDLHLPRRHLHEFLEALVALPCVREIRELKTE